MNRLLFLTLLLWTPLAAAEHPVLTHDLRPENRARLEKETMEFMEMPEAELLAMVPVQTPFITSDCPSCGNGHFTRGLERKLFKFIPPAQVECVKCQTVFPSEKFPLNETESFLNPLGESVEISFHQDAKGVRFALPGAIQSWQNGWLTQNMQACGRLYQITKDEKYARRVALLLDRYAQVFPHYLVKDFLTDHIDGEESNITQKATYAYVSTGGPWMRNRKKYAEKPEEPAASTKQTNIPYGWTQSRWGWGRFGGDIPEELIRAYDLVYDSPEFEKLGPEVRPRLVKDLFGNSVAFLQEFPFWYHLNNNASGHIAGIIRAGRVAEQPEWVHFGYRWSREVLEKYVFSREGAFGESPGYFYVFMASQEDNFHALNGYSDPPGFVGKDGLHLENLGQTGAMAFLEKARKAGESIRFPNGSYLPLGDNRHDDFADPLFRPGARGEVLERSEDVLLAGYGHAILGDGAADRQVQAHLHYAPFKGVTHAHSDGLSLMLWAFGAELFTDVGYHKTKYRGFASTTLSHNTVVVDRAPQDGLMAKGNLLLYEPNLPGISIAQVEDKQAYGDKLTRYRSTLLLNTRNLEAPYLVDVFEVRGGKMHDYALHGPTIFESVAETALPLAPMEGERPLLAVGETWGNDTIKSAYGAFTNVRAGQADGDFSVDFKLIKPFELPEYKVNSRYKAGSSFHYAADPASYREKLELGVRTHFPAGADKMQVLLSDSPSMIRSGLEGGPLTEKLKRPSLILRREGKEGLSSVYVAVHEPYYGAPKIASVKRLPVSGPGLALRIETAESVDLVMLSLEGAQNIRAGTVSLMGCAGLISAAKGGAAPVGYLVGGTELNAGSVVVKSPVPGYRGVVQAVTSQWAGAAENAFVTNSPLPVGEALRGAWMLVALGDGGVTDAFEIDRVESREGKTWVLLKDETGLRTEGATTTEIFFPRRTFTGENKFLIHARAMTP